MNRIHLPVLARSFFAASSLSLSFACSEARNSPEQAFRSLTTALSGQEWDLLCDILPIDEQKHRDERIEAVLARDEDSNKLLAQLGVEGGATILDELKLTEEHWVAPPQKEKFVRVFGLNAKVNLGAGHQGASGRYDFLKERAFEFTFLLDRLGRVGPPVWHVPVLPSQQPVG